MTTYPVSELLRNSPAMDERQVRVELAAALRMAARLGMHEGICNHFSVRLPGPSWRFLMNPRGRHWSRMRASDLVVIDETGRTVEGTGEPLRTGFTIHSRIHMLHPGAGVVFHTHMPYATALTAIKGGRLLQVHQNAARFLDRCAYDDEFAGLAFDPSEGERMAEVFGDKSVLFLGNHGVVVVADTIAEGFDDLFYLERACEIQVLAMSTGRPLAEIPPEVARETAAQFAGRRGSAEAHLAEVMAILDEAEPAYRD
ncbi:MAG: aldolase [Chromatiales bacterium]|nr:aldolase [Chromatiales bacterium]